MRCKKFLAVLLLTGLLMLSAPLALADSTYTDTEGHWAESAIERWSELEVIIGFEGEFRPNDSIIRGEMALIIDRIFQYVEAASNPFSDLADDMWYTDAVLKCNNVGVMLGYLDKARPEDTITREEAMNMVARALGMDDINTNTSLSYADADSVADWAYQVMAMLENGGYITDCTTNLRPKENITRAEVVNLLDNLIGTLLRDTGLYTVSERGNTVITAEQIMLMNSQIGGYLIIAGGATDRVVLENVEIDSSIINKSNADLSHNSGRLGDTIISSRGESSPTEGVPRNTYSASGFYKDAAGRTQYSYNGLTAITGIDISEWQADINWSKVAGDGIDFAIIRAGCRGTTEGKLYEDIKFHQNMQGAQAAGLDVGVYFFSQAITVEEAVEEANMTLELIRGYNLQLPVFYDWEWTSSPTDRTAGMTGKQITDCFVAYCEVISQAGYEVGIYSNTSLAYDDLDLSRLTDYCFWYAAYNSLPEFYYHFDIWQYSSSGSVDGITGNVDMNLSFIKF